MDFTEFSNFHSFKLTDLFLEIEHINNKPGVYAVYSYNKIKINLKSSNSKLKKYPTDFLLKRAKLYECDDDKQLLYIGSSKHLKKRIKQLYETIYKERTKHSGGKALCQIENLDDLIVECGNIRDYSDTEKKQLINFANEHGFLPFANMRFNGL